MTTRLVPVASTFFSDPLVTVTVMLTYRTAVWLVAAELLGRYA